MTEEESLAEFPIAAFDHLKPDTPQADELRWALERAMHAVLRLEGRRGLTRGIRHLNALGHGLTCAEERGAWCRHTGLVAGGKVRMDITALVNDDLVTTGVTFAAAEPPPLPPGQAAAEERRQEFYAWFNRVALAEPVDVEDLPEPDRIVYCVGWLEAEVNNGGFGQYFWNTGGIHAEDTLVALWAIGARDTAELMTRAVALAPPPGMDGQARAGAREGLDRRYGDELDRLSDRFCRGPDDLALLVMDFLDPGPGGDPPLP